MQIAANSGIVNGKWWNQALGDVVERSAGTLFGEKITSLDILDMHFVNRNIFVTICNKLASICLKSMKYEDFEHFAYCYFCERMKKDFEGALSLKDI